MIEAIILDMDGLMFDSENLGVAACGYALEGMGYKADDELFKSVLGTTTESCKRRFKTVLGEDFDFDGWLVRYNQKVDEVVNTTGIPMKKGLVELIAYLDEHKIKRAIASSSSRARVAHFTGSVGLEASFPVMVCGDMIERSKPDPEIFLIAAKALETDRANCLVLEDSPNGVLAGYRSGIRTVMVPDLIPPTDKEREMAFAIVDSLLDVPAILARG